MECFGDRVSSGYGSSFGCFGGCIIGNLVLVFSVVAGESFGGTWWDAATTARCC